MCSKITFRLKKSSTMIISCCLVLLSTATIFSQSQAKGIDISKYQGKIVADITAADGMSFIICKATEGITYTDPDFEFNWRTIKKKDIIRGAYHFYRTNDDPVKQVDNFLAAIATLDSLDIAPILDIEQGGVVGSPSVDQVQKDLLIWLAKIEKETARCPIIYTGLNFANTWLNHESFRKYPIWLAEYISKETPSLPDQWVEKGYAFWQKTDKHTIESEKTDFDVFKGSYQELLKFIEEY